MAARAGSTGRRLTPEARREQLVRTAMALLAAEGLAALTFDAVARRAQVTRNLLYHYFPEGTGELLAAVADLAGRDIVDGWVTDPEVPLEERRARNFAALLEHAGAPTDAWAASRITSVLHDPAVRAISTGYRGRLVDAMALNAFGGPPTPLQRAALEAYLAYGERFLEAAREHELQDDDVLRMLVTMLEQTVAAARSR